MLTVASHFALRLVEKEKATAMIQVLEWYGAISALSTAAFFAWGWAHGQGTAQ